MSNHRVSSLSIGRQQTTNDCVLRLTKVYPSVVRAAPAMAETVRASLAARCNLMQITVVRSTHVVLPDKVAPANVIIKAGKIVEVTSYEHPIAHGAHVVDVGALHVMAGAIAFSAPSHAIEPRSAP